MKPLQPPDSHYLNAAQGWLELGNHAEADAELDNIEPSSRAHPDVLNVRGGIYAAAKKWQAALVRLLPVAAENIAKVTVIM